MGSGERLGWVSWLLLHGCGCVWASVHALQERRMEPALPPRRLLATHAPPRSPSPAWCAAGASFCIAPGCPPRSWTATRPWTSENRPTTTPPCCWRAPRWVFSMNSRRGGTVPEDAGLAPGAPARPHPEPCMPPPPTYRPTHPLNRTQVGRLDRSTLVTNLTLPAQKGGGSGGGGGRRGAFQLDILVEVRRCCVLLRAACCSCAAFALEVHRAACCSCAA